MSMDTSERLQAYYPFSPETIDVVSEVAERQRGFATYGDFFDAIGLDEPQLYHPERDRETGYPVSVLDIRPKEHDPAEAVIIRLAMGNPLDPNQLFQVATIAAANPDKRFIAVSNPAGGKFKQDDVPALGKLGAVAKGNFDALAWPATAYALDHGTQLVQEVGFSYGAILAASAAALERIDVKRLLAIEPVVGDRSLLRLGWDFARTGGPLDDYVNASELDIFRDARQDSLGLIPYGIGLARPANLAIAWALRRDRLQGYVTDFLQGVHADRAVFAWGTDSELATDARMMRLVSDLELLHAGRIGSIILKDQRHNMVNDVHLHAALVREGLII